VRLLLLTRYTREAASSRYRYFQYLPYLRSAGFECVVMPLFRSGFLNRRFSNRRALAGRTVLDYCRRVYQVSKAGGFDLILIEKEVLPYIPSGAELGLLPAGVPTAYDYDDAWFYVYSNHHNALVRRLLSEKISRLMSSASTVIAGSAHIYEYACNYNSSVNYLPTVLDLSRYPASQPCAWRSGPFRIGWIGSQSTVEYLEHIAHVLDEFCRTHDAEVVLIGPEKDSLVMEHVRRLRWSESSEVEALSSIDVGIMPLSDTPWARGKCAFKLIQYMACWKPVIASAVGENRIVVEHEVDGFLAESAGEWLDALSELYSKPAVAKAMGEKGRSKVEAQYSLAIAAPKFASILSGAATIGGLR
jgi:glycosyltransferase involved in cell wall biosynthesis